MGESRRSVCCSEVVCLVETLLHGGRLDSRESLENVLLGRWGGVGWGGGDMCRLRTGLVFT